MGHSNPKRTGLTLMELVVVLLVLVALAAILVPMMSGVTQNAQQTTTQVTMTTLRNAVLQYYQDMKGIPLSRTPPGTTFMTDSSGIPQTLKDLQFIPATVDANGNPVAFNPVTGRGWRGPYLLQATGTIPISATAPSPGTSIDASFYPTGTGSPPYGSLGDIAFLDGWGNPIVLQWPNVGTGSTTNTNLDLSLRVQNVRLVSAGPKSVNASGNLANVIDTLQSALMPTGPTTAALLSLPNQRGNDLVQFILIQDPAP